MSEDNKIKGILAGFFLGGAIGGAIALLYAPKSGKHLRNDIRWKTKELSEDWMKKADDIWNDTKDNTENMRENAKILINTGKDKITDETKKSETPVKNRV